MRLAPAERQAAIIAAIFKHKAFRDSFTNCLGLDPLEDNVEMEKRIVVAMRNAHLYNVEADSTFHRRASTVKQWLEWIKSKQNG
jgi:hypothetical protein